MPVARGASALLARRPDTVPTRDDELTVDRAARAGEARFGRALDVRLMLPFARVLLALREPTARGPTTTRDGRCVTLATGDDLLPKLCDGRRLALRPDVTLPLWARRVDVPVRARLVRRRDVEREDLVKERPGVRADLLREALRRELDRPVRARDGDRLALERATVLLDFLAPDALGDLVRFGDPARDSVAAANTTAQPTTTDSHTRALVRVLITCSPVDLLSTVRNVRKPSDVNSHRLLNNTPLVRATQGSLIRKLGVEL